MGCSQGRPRESGPRGVDDSAAGPAGRPPQQHRRGSGHPAEVRPVPCKVPIYASLDRFSDEFVADCLSDYPITDCVFPLHAAIGVQHQRTQLW